MGRCRIDHPFTVPTFWEYCFVIIIFSRSLYLHFYRSSLFNLLQYVLGLYQFNQIHYYLNTGEAGRGGKRKWQVAPSRAVLGASLQYTLVTAGRAAFMADLSLFEKKSWCMVSKKKEAGLYPSPLVLAFCVCIRRSRCAQSRRSSVRFAPAACDACWSLLMNKISLGVLGCTRLKILKCCSLECMLLLMGP